MRGQDAVIKRIEKRIADFTFIPIGTHDVPLVLVLRFVPLTTQYWRWFTQMLSNRRCD